MLAPALALRNPLIASFAGSRCVSATLAELPYLVVDFWPAVLLLGGRGLRKVALHLVQEGLALVSSHPWIPHNKAAGVHQGIRNGSAQRSTVLRRLPAQVRPEVKHRQDRGGLWQAVGSRRLRLGSSEHGH